MNGCSFATKSNTLRSSGIPFASLLRPLLTISAASFTGYVRIAAESESVWLSAVRLSPSITVIGSPSSSR